MNTQICAVVSGATPAGKREREREREEEVYDSIKRKWMTRKIEKSNALLCGWGMLLSSWWQCLESCVCACVCDWCGVLCCVSCWMIGLLIFPLAEHKSLFYPPSLNLSRVKCLCSQLLTVQCVTLSVWHILFVCSAEYRKIETNGRN